MLLINHFTGIFKATTFKINGNFDDGNKRCYHRFLRCSGYRTTGCRGKGYMLRDKGIESFVLLAEHTHPPNFLMERRSEIAKTLKDFARTIPGKPIDVYNSVVSM